MSSGDDVSVSASVQEPFPSLTCETTEDQHTGNASYAFLPLPVGIP